MNWMWTGSIMKSMAEVQRLIDFIVSDEFNKEDLVGFILKAETARFDRALAGDVGDAVGNASGVKDGWKEVEVEIEVPDGAKRGPSDPLPVFSVPGLHFRNLTQTIKSALQDPSARFFHYTPFKQFWQRSPAEPAERIYDEIYSSPAFIKAHEKIQRQPAESNCTLERVVAALMWWSDSTHLANFGTASLWPIYLLFGNQSKYVRGKPRAGACHHVAYIPKLPDNFFDWFKDLTGHSPSAEVLTHCRRELMHAIWRLMLDGEFIEACKHGIVVECPDGVSRRFYFRVFTYSADYPEKVLLATIRNLGHCPCPRCLVTKDKLDQLGTVRDAKTRVQERRVDDEGYRFYIRKARDWIYRLGKVIRAQKVEGLLAAKSLVPTVNTFSVLTSFGASIFDMLVPDLLHEMELGVWKAVFTHLIRILVASGGDVVQALNDRYRQVPTFGKATIRRLTNNASAMKKLAARNFEDLLQCALPVFEELLDGEHDTIVLDLLFILAYWHALAKLRMHTDFTVDLLDSVTTLLGRQLRHFRKVTCAAFTTKELPREEAARGRRNAKKSAAAAAAGTAPPVARAGVGSKVKTFNMETCKTHSLGDYAPAIRMFGTTDSYSTQTCETEHQDVKAYYARTNKNDAVGQITQLERREAALKKITRTRSRGDKRQTKARGPNFPRKVLPTLDFTESESLPYTPPEVHFHISMSRNFHCNIPSWLAEHAGDPAIADFLPKLREHLLSRLLHPTWSGDGSEFTELERAKVLIVNHRLYRHKVLRINYTSYDLRRGQDSMNPRTHADVMMLAPEDSVDVDHTFTYARVIGVFHVDVLDNVAGAPTAPVPISFLWVRRFRLDRTFKGGFLRRRLHRIEFIPEDDPSAFGFVDPDEVIRGAHLIPAFAHGPTERVAHQSLARHKGEFDDWKYYYVNFFVDRDMFMRYLGGGVRHYRVPMPHNAAADENTNDAGDESGDEGEDADPAVEEEVSLLDQFHGEEEDEDEEPELPQEEEDSEEEGDPWSENEEEEEEDLGPEDGEGGLEAPTPAEFGYEDY
ncbi:hypothetical protein C8R46DRAFT_1161271 [Mycena filopes]|nr:hypothetical protein C8R46DRAFT_1161271 [Mycena filopes]